VSARVEDLRYPRYDGPRRGRAAALAALARTSAMTALGARRSWRAKVIPAALTLVAAVPAIVALGARAFLAGRLGHTPELFPYRGYFALVSVVILAFSAVIAPEMLCPDRRDRVLDLYYATAVSPREYLAAKLAGTCGPLLLVTTLPVVVLFLGNTLFAVHPVGYLEQHGADLPRIIISGVLITVYYAVVGLAVASLTTRRAFAVGGFLGLMVVSSSVSGVLVQAVQASRLFELVALPLVPITMTQRIFPRPDHAGVPGVATGAWMLVYVAVVVVASAVLAARYRSAST
jgi:ABC-2 type transport system permease protein